ncbi:ECF RNA polymerase sigma-E factor [Aquisphaera giovannonii]|uniref:ECF RNA polymerase sigma-E factor n=1 Tax=Aquisphaera giovannonii TaxID=406548 RepID=A0A5B9WFL4_9BACT|nr:sigma-70 family RNA polymerase sigma factor [Aquisphaera giovannonii]QEH39059.1 ECF RNA polymerase sigma-E factor [Aquisphaera giovannonii]
MTMSRTGDGSDTLLEQARSGAVETRGLLLDRYRNYLMLLARAMMGRGLRSSLEASDLVQQTFLEAYRDLPMFRGSGERELVGWLRRILIHNVCQQAEYLGRQKRGGKRQVSLDELLERSDLLMARAHGCVVASPSECADRSERTLLLADALARLPESQRTALELHHLQGLTVPEVGREMGRSVLAVTGLIYRGMKALRALLTPA